MTPFSARLTLLGFLALVGAFAANALFLQEPLDRDARVTGSVAQSGQDSAARPAATKEQAAEAAPKGDLQTIARQARDAEAESRPSAAKRPAAPPPPEVVRAIQRELAFRNYAIDRRDGELDQATRLAILNYQYDTGLPLTGQPSEELLKHILFGPFQSAPDVARVRRLENDRDLVANVQRILSGLGFGNLSDSGRLGPDTREALREFAAFRDLPLDARLSPRLLLELADVTDAPLRPGSVNQSQNFSQP